MILSRVRLSARDCAVRRIYSDYDIHRFVYSMFIDDSHVKRDFLFCDEGVSRGIRSIVIFSKRIPQKPEVGILEYKLLDDMYFSHTYYQFSIKLNPVRKDSVSRERIPITDKLELQEWFGRLSVRNGFQSCAELVIERKEPVITKKKQFMITLSSFVFSGIMEIIDKEKFIIAVENGLGHGKSFGFGLMKILPVENKK